MRKGRPDSTIAKLSLDVGIGNSLGMRCRFHQQIDGPEVLDGDALENLEDGCDEAEEEDDGYDGVAEIGEGHRRISILFFSLTLPLWAKVKWREASE